MLGASALRTSGMSCTVVACLSANVALYIGTSAFTMSFSTAFGTGVLCIYMTCLSADTALLYGTA